MHSPLFQIFPLFSKKFQTLWKMSKMLPFPEKFLNFHPSKSLMTFFIVIDHKFRISPFSLFRYISPSVSRKLLFPPYFQKFPPVLEKFTCFLHTLCVFRLPPTLTMMHSCITQCTYWTPLHKQKCISEYVKLEQIRKKEPEHQA